MILIRHIFVLALFVLFADNAVRAQGMAVNTTGTEAAPSAMLDVSSTTQGMLVPRMLQAQRTLISSPATGLLVYQTDGASGFYFYNGSAWTSLNSGAPSGSAGGDLSGTYPNPTIANSGVGSGSYGSSSQVPTYTVNTKGQLTAASNTSIAIPGSAITSGTISTARMGSGAASSATYLRGDGTWNTPAGGGGGGSSSYIWCMSNSVVTNNSTVYSGFITSNTTASSAEINTVKTIVSSSFTIDAWYITGYNRYSGGSANNDIVGVLYKNGSATSMTVSLRIVGTKFSAATNLVNDTSHSVSVVAGDQLYIVWTNSNIATGYRGAVNYSFHAY